MIWQKMDESMRTIENWPTGSVPFQHTMLNSLGFDTKIDAFTRLVNKVRANQGHLWGEVDICHNWSLITWRFWQRL